MSLQSCTNDDTCGAHCVEGLFYDLDELEEILSGETYTMPPGLSREEMREWLSNPNDWVLDSANTKTIV